jgi:phosphoenolpyruvate synthase/pyruvate phosphate dikinase
MRKARAFITDGGGTRHFHVVSRIVNRDCVLGVEEKEFFRKTMRKLETFSGAKILT